MDLHRYTYLLVLIIIPLIVLMGGCSSCNRTGDERLSRIETFVSKQPTAALDSLSRINPDELSAADKNLYDFLTIKATDKAFITHTSDSLILKVIAFARKHKPPYYLETLYYGARVYSDLGDYPTSLSYFHQTLEEMPEDIEDIDFKANVLSQTGRLLHVLRMNEHAVKFFKETIKIDRQLNDTINEIQDLKLLGAAFYRNKDFDKAQDCFKESLSKCNNATPSLRKEISLYLAKTYYAQDRIDSALNILRHVVNLPTEGDNSVEMIIAAKIYIKAGITDSAYYAARQILRTTHRENKRLGYYYLLLPSLRRYSHPDTLANYALLFSQEVEKIFNDNDNQVTLIQQAQFNYALHEREKQKTEKKNFILLRLIIFALTLLFIICVATLVQKTRNQKNIIKLQQAITEISDLRSKLNAKEYERRSESHSSVSDDMSAQKIPAMPTIDNLREKLKNELIEICSDPKNNYIPDEIFKSDACRILKEYIAKGTIITEKNEIWTQMENVILNASPNYLNRLNLLMRSKVTLVDRQTILLIKFGLTPSQMASLLGRTKATIVSRRKAISKKIFDQELDLNLIDNIIRIL